jgi:hypothetical protein
MPASKAAAPRTPPPTSSSPRKPGSTPSSSRFTTASSSSNPPKNDNHQQRGNVTSEEFDLFGWDDEEHGHAAALPAAPRHHPTEESPSKLLFESVRQVQERLFDLEKQLQEQKAKLAVANSDLNELVKVNREWKAIIDKKLYVFEQQNAKNGAKEDDDEELAFTL